MFLRVGGKITMNYGSHGIMFHHFHDDKKHIVGQGSISAEQLDDMLDYYGKTHNIISADEFLYKFEHDYLQSKDVCLTFDDGLLCQYDVAYPVLEQRGIKAFWFVYTSPSDGILEKLEIYRHFRFSKFTDIDEFYEAFFEMAKEECENVVNELVSFNPDTYAISSPFYTRNDKRFRYLRDRILGDVLYNQIMDKMIIEYKYNILENKDLLWIKQEEIKRLHNHGHIIGLHSHTHPTLMSGKDIKGQRYEYGTNKKRLETIIGKEIISASYPCNSYNIDTIQCMRELDIQIAFRANMQNERIDSLKYEYPREDHANILRAMKEN